VVLSAFTLTPIDSIAFEYQLSDLNFMGRLALLRFVGFDFFCFCLTCSGVMGPTRPLVRTKPPLLLGNRRFIGQHRMPMNRIVRGEIEGQSMVFLEVVPKTLAALAQNFEAGPLLGVKRTLINRQPTAIYQSTP
jgi:hypothetical protein